MKQKNSKLVFYVLGIIILLGIIFVATKNISPEIVCVEKTITTK